MLWKIKIWKNRIVIKKGISKLRNKDGDISFYLYVHEKRKFLLKNYFFNDKIKIEIKNDGKDWNFVLEFIPGVK